LASGFSNEALRDTTGFVVERIDFHDRQNLHDEKNYPKEKFWNFIMDGFEQKNLMGCSATGSTEVNKQYPIFLKYPNLYWWSKLDADWSTESINTDILKELFALMEKTQVFCLVMPTV